MNNQHTPPRAKELRALARETLKGQWFIAILTTFIASLLGGLNSSSPNLNISTSNLDIDLSQYLPTEGLEAIDLSEMLMPILPLIIPFAIGILAVSMVYLIEAWPQAPVLRQNRHSHRYPCTRQTRQR